MNTFLSVISLTNHVDHPSLAQTNCVALFSTGPCGLLISLSSIFLPRRTASLLRLFFFFYFKFYCYCSHVLEAKQTRRLLSGVCRTKIAEIHPLICRFTGNVDIRWVILHSVFHALHSNLCPFSLLPNAKWAYDWPAAFGGLCLHYVSLSSRCSSSGTNSTPTAEHRGSCNDDIFHHTLHY